ncbi:SDR family NAD(P)-dependent oxidoreductase [Streptomyces sp. NPDC101249]|uniref:SDR family NAD(P)-dependent oxidoreductase n=1 Tax=Streptomyces sp. NPDC101249 TaxID=3366140 RepID=UPI003816AC9C
MDETNTPGGGRQTPLTRALGTIRSLRRQLGERQGNQPVAIIGAGLRLPGGIDTLDGYWTALAEGRDLVRPLPDHRKGPFADAWRGVPQRGGFLDEVLDFDAEFFGISPREARHLDPQHRLLLEVAWEAMEHAAVPADALAAARTGLYLGVMWQDYREWCQGEPDAYWATGNGHNFAAGRVAYALGLTGPTLTVDTACSSSLVAVHLAVQALRRGECDLAFAAGANLIMSPATMRLVQETRSLSPDGLCKTFDSRANGFARGEGVGVVLLKRLDHALRDGDRVLGVIRGTAVNQDGRSSGFTAPNVLAQVSLIEAALSDAGLEPAAVGYAETHGTGTALGDPIEMAALATALGRRNGGAPLPVGAVKTNFGHLEGTAGVAGLIKATLCVSRRQVPPVVHFRHLNPRIDLSGTGITVPASLREWSPLSGDCASVSSFGMSGTNAHAVVGPPLPEERADAPAASGPVTVTGFEISARNADALRERAAGYAAALEALDPADYPAFAHTATAGRTRMETRAHVTATGPAEAARALRALAEGRTSPETGPGRGAAAGERTPGERTAPGAVPRGAHDPGTSVGALPRKVVDLPAYPWQRRRFAPRALPVAPVAAPSGDALPLVHEVTWQRADDVPAGAVRARPVVLAGDDTDLLGALAARAAALGVTGTVLAPSAPDLPGDWRHAPLPADADAWAATWHTESLDPDAPLLLALRATELPGAGAESDLPSPGPEAAAPRSGQGSGLPGSVPDGAGPGRAADVAEASLADRRGLDSETGVAVTGPAAGLSGPRTGPAIGEADPAPVTGVSGSALASDASGSAPVTGAPGFTPTIDAPGSAPIAGAPDPAPAIDALDSAPIAEASDFTLTIDVPDSAPIAGVPGPAPITGASDLAPTIDPLDSAPTPGAAAPELGTPGAELCAAVAAAVAGLARERGGARVFALTRGARRTRPEDTVAATDHGLLHGLAPVLGLELGAGWGGVVDLPGGPAGPADADLDALLRFVARETEGALAHRPAEDLAAVRDGVTLVARLTEMAAPDTGRPTVRPDATYLVTGGLGGVGRELTAELVALGARHLLLVGRRPADRLDAEATELLRRLDTEGVRVVYRPGGCDTAAAVAALRHDLRDMPPVRGVLHAAGTLERVPAADTGAAGFAASLRGKFAGAWLLHLASLDWPLDFFVTVSSVSAVWGTDRCAAYAAANGGLDALAAHRAGLGLPASSIAYGPWDLGESGMADSAARDGFARLGVGALDPATGRAALGARGSVAGHVVVCPLDGARFRAVMARFRARGLLDATDRAHHQDRTGIGATVAAVPAVSTAPAEPSVVAELAALPERGRPAAARAHVARIVAAQLGFEDAESVRHDAGFFDLGLDSLMAVDLVDRLGQAFGVTLRAADVFDHPSVTRVTEYLLTLDPDPATDPTADSDPVADLAPAPVPGPTASLRPAPAADPPPDASAAPDPHEPIAIVGMAGRFPQADSVDELWDLLRTGRDAVGPVPEGRYDTAAFHGDGDGPGRITTDQGGFLKDVSRFDAAFFGIPAREAENLDPQQRLLLESAWHALEDGGLDPHALRSTRTGVFVGVSYADYARLLAAPGADRVDAYYSTGTSLNAAAGRLAYVLGLNGPALAVDTACSSSLVALHLAVRSLRSGESDAALAGGVNVILDPTASVAASRAHMLSPDGRCRSFSADADGFVRAEGCAVLVLKRLRDARRDGDRVLAVIRGTAVNQDGASSGLTAPSGTAQRALLADALADARTDGRQVSYLEAHGTGTALGDPVELGAAWRVFGPGRKPGEPLHIGSVKSNIGHCESAAGMAAVVKTVLAMRHDLLPANLHFAAPNPHVDWADMNVRVVDTPTPWRSGTAPRVAGVSGFGLSGTNAHVVLADPPAGTPAATSDDPAGTPHLVPLSAPDAPGLERLTAAWRERLTGADDGELAGLAATATAGRAHFPYRHALLGRTRDELLARLADPPPARAGTGRPRIAFLFSGQGSQRFGMGRELYESEPVFRDVFDRCDRELAPALGGSLVELVLYGADQRAVHETRVTQPALFALESALAALWESWGVVPDVVMGHSVGEITAAVHAGVMDLSAGLRLIARRGALMQGTRRGAMLAVRASEERLRTLLGGAALDVAAVNTADSTVVAGTPEEIDRFAARLTAEGVRGTRLTVSHAFHSRLLDPVLPELRATAAELDLGDPLTPLISNLTGRLAEPGTLDAGYWVRHAREPVRFHDGAHLLAEQKVDVCLEIGPDATLVNLVRAAGTVPAAGLLPSMRRGSTEHAGLAAAAATLYELGHDIDWAARWAPRRTPRAAAPLYPFAVTTFWRGTTTAGPARPGTSPASGTPGPAPATVPGAPPWGTPLRSPAIDGRVFVTERSTVYPPHLDDHRLFGTVQVAGASQTATVLSALSGDGGAVVLEDLHFPRALVLHDDERYEMQIVERDGTGGNRAVSVQSLLDPETGRWQEHLTARRPAGDPVGHREAPDPRAFAARAERHLGGEAFYRHLRGIGYLLGPSFSWVKDAWIHGDEALIRFEPPARMSEPAEEYAIHPGLLDSCLQSSVCFAVHDDAEPAHEEPALVIPFAAARVAFPGGSAAGRSLWGHVRADLRPAAGTGFHQVERADLHLFDDSGATVLAMDGFRFRLASRSVLRASLRRSTPHTWDLVTREVPDPGATTVEQTASRTVAVVGAATVDQAASRTVADSGPDPVPAPGVRLMSKTVSDPDPDPAPASVDRTASRTVAVVGAATPAGRLLTRALGERGHRAVPTDGASPFPGPAPDLVLDARFLAAPPADPRAATEAVLALATTLRAAPAAVPYAVLAGAGVPEAPLRETLWGLAASLEAEQRERRLLRVTLTDGWDADRLLRTLERILDDGAVETRVETGLDGTRVGRLVPATGTGTPAGPLTGAALVTGGLGGLGLSTAAILARNGCADLTLMSRSDPDAAARRALDALTVSGTRVRVLRGDVTDPGDCARAVAEATADQPLRRVLHLAGVTDDRAFDRVDRAAAERVFAAKALGATTLAEAVRGHDLDAFVLFSSASSVLGSAGQTVYAAANGYLNGLAERLRAEGVPATAVAWGPWTPEGEGGLAATEAVRRATARLGVGALTDDTAEPLLLAALAAREARTIAVDLAADRYTAALDGHPRARLLADAAGPPRDDRPAAAARPRGWFGAHLGTLAPDDRDEALAEFVRATAGETLGQQAARDDDTTFGDMGLDSIMVIDLRTRLSHALGVDLLATVALDHPTVPRLTAHVLGLLRPTPPALDGAPQPTDRTDHTARTDRTNPTDHTDRTGRTERTVPSGPAERAEQQAPAEHSVPSQPSQPSRPSQPSEAPDPAEMSFDELLRAVRSDVSREGDSQA